MPLASWTLKNIAAIGGRLTASCTTVLHCCLSSSVVSLIQELMLFNQLVFGLLLERYELFPSQSTYPFSSLYVQRLTFFYSLIIYACAYIPSLIMTILHTKASSLKEVVND